MESCCVVDVIGVKTSELGTIFFICQSTRISGVPASGLKELYRTYSSQHQEKIKFTLKQAMRAQRWSRDFALVFL